VNELTIQKVKFYIPIAILIAMASFAIYLGCLLLIYQIKNINMPITYQTGYGQNLEIKILVK